MVDIPPRQVAIVLVIGQRPALAAHSRLAERHNVISEYSPRCHVKGEELSCSAAQAMPCKPPLASVLAVVGPIAYSMK